MSLGSLKKFERLKLREAAHAEAKKRSEKIIEILLYRIREQVPGEEPWRNKLLADPSDLKLADKLFAELLRKTYVLPRLKKRRARAKS